MSSPHPFIQSIVPTDPFKKREHYTSSRLLTDPGDVFFANHPHVYQGAGKLLRFVRAFFRPVDLLASRQALVDQDAFDLFAGDVADRIDGNSSFKEDRLDALAVRNSQQTIVSLAPNIANQIRNELLAETSVHFRPLS